MGQPMGQPMMMPPGMMANQYPPYNPSADAQYMGTHPEYVDPGPHRMTGKQLVQWFSAGILLGFFLGALFMFQLYEPLIRVIDAVRGK